MASKMILKVTSCPDLTRLHLYKTVQEYLSDISAHISEDEADVLDEKRPSTRPATPRPDEPLESVADEQSSLQGLSTDLENLSVARSVPGLVRSARSVTLSPENARERTMARRFHESDLKNAVAALGATVDGDKDKSRTPTKGLSPSLNAISNALPTIHSMVKLDLNPLGVLPSRTVKTLNAINFTHDDLPLFEFNKSLPMTRKKVQYLNKMQTLSETGSILADLKRDPRAPIAEVGDDVFEIQIASDIHIEMFARDHEHDLLDYFDTIIKPKCANLALCGDIGCPGTENGLDIYTQFLLTQANQFENVFVIAGNHEYYIQGFRSHNKYTIQEMKQRIQNVCDMRSNLHFLDQGVFVDGNVRVVGCTLWSDIPSAFHRKVEAGVNDYHLCYMPRTDTAADSDDDFPFPLTPKASPVAESKIISSSPLSITGTNDPIDGESDLRGLTAIDTCNFHHSDLKFLQEQAKEAKALGQRVIVLTHHVPTFRNTSNPRYRQSPIKWAFATSLEYMMDYDDSESDYSAIHTWVSGHTHWSCDQYINGVHVVSNQFGYVNTAECTYNPSFVVKV